ncbi:hypothetical protein [Paralimibaculum aggregatum]|nr:hypothetical protein [Limibaculum sp. NKW23]
MEIFKEGSWVVGIRRKRSRHGSTAVVSPEHAEPRAAIEALIGPVEAFDILSAPSSEPADGASQEAISGKPPEAGPSALQPVPLRGAQRSTAWCNVAIAGRKGASLRLHGWSRTRASPGNRGPPGRKKQCSRRTEDQIE